MYGDCATLNLKNNNNKPMKLISACLLGVACRYDGKSKPCEKALKIFNQNKNEFVLVCPEQLGGLSTPRVPSEIQNSTGEEVLFGNGITAALLKQNGFKVSTDLDL